MEGCGGSSSGPKEVRLNAAALSDPDSFRLFVSFSDFLPLTSNGLVDSGSTHCFIDSSFVLKHSLPDYEIPPVSLRLIDGSAGAMITRAADLKLRFSTSDILTIKFYVTTLESSTALVFGHNWLHCYNLLIDWSAGQLLSF